MNILDIMDVNRMKKRTILLIICNIILFIFNVYMPIFLFITYIETNSSIILFFSGISLGFSLEFIIKKIKKFFQCLKDKKKI